MAVNFFKASQKNVPNLNQTERQLFEYVVKNMDQVKNMSIQKFAADRYLSTTTIFRFTQKLGFSGYTEFINSLMVTTYQSKLEVPEVLYQKTYSEDYLKNIIETVRVMPDHDVNQVMELLARTPDIYILSDDNSSAAGFYGERLFLGLGHRAYYMEIGYQLATLPDRVQKEDMIIALSYSGDDSKLMEAVERVLIKKRPFLVSITRADNNPLQSISDVNFYVFADAIRSHSIDLTSSVPIIILLELLAYGYITQKGPS